MSRVYLAREELPDRDVAIKVLDEELSARLGRERFVREVEVTSQLGHPHIVPIHAAGDAGGTLYYVMPYIEGESLRDRLGREGRLPIDDALKITHQVADALQHAHDKGIVHRDIKPANILIQSGHAVVADFGIARALRVSESGGEFTQSGLPLGTPDYMSPEQASGEEAIDGRTDTYALACVVYEMLAGQPPFHSRTARATLARHLTDTVPSLKSLRASVPRGVEQVIAEALSKAPQDRPKGVLRFADALVVANSFGTPANAQADSKAFMRRSLTTPVRLAGAFLVVAALGIALQVWSSGVSADDRWETSLAVMPFENRTGNPALDNLGLSLAEEIIGHFTEIPEVGVMDSYTTASLLNDSLGTPLLLDTLNVEHIIYGYIESRDGDIVVNVVESDLDGFLSQRTQHVIDPESLSVAQGALANSVVLGFLKEVGLSVEHDPDGSVIGPGRDAYLAGMAALGERTPGAMREAIGFFREAIDREPMSSAALSSLSSTYALSLYYRFNVGVPSYELAARALAAADSAIIADPGEANGYSARGFVRALLGIEINGAEEDFARAEAIAPNAPNGPSWSARILAQKGMIDEAFREARRARDLDPLQSGRRIALATLGFQLGDYDVTIVEAREAYRLQEELALAKAFEGRALALTGRGAACLDLEFGVYDLVRALCLYQLGRETEARALVEEAGRRLTGGESDDSNYLPALAGDDLASYYALSGDAANAARWLEYAFDLSPAGIDTRLLGSALFDTVRNDVVFATALSEAQARARKRVADTRDQITPPL